MLDRHGLLEIQLFFLCFYPLNVATLFKYLNKCLSDEVQGGSNLLESVDESTKSGHSESF